MDFTTSEAQDELAGLARKILAGRGVAGHGVRGVPGGPERPPGLAEWDTPWADLATAGVLAAGLPEALGGAGLGLLEHCSVLTEIGRAVSDVPYLASIVLGAGALAEFGTPAQAARWATPAGRGSVVLTAALAEEDGDDPRFPSTRAQRAGGGWRLSGVKTAVPAAPRAELFLVPAATSAGVVVFGVSPSDAGVSVEPQQLTDFAEAGRVVLDGVPLDDDRVLGRPGRGAEITGWLVSRAIVGLCAMQAGVIERALELTAEYARTRVQFGRPIGSFQAVAQRLADAYIDVEAVRLTMWQAAWLLASGGEAGTAVATAKFWAADAGHRVAHTAVHVHGGLGIDMSYPVHRYFTAAKHHEFALGGATAQLRRIGADLAQAVPSEAGPSDADARPRRIYPLCPLKQQRGNPWMRQRTDTFG